jgi:hypothetical protein
MPHSVTSENCQPIPETEYQTTTKARCFACALLVELEQTTSQRLCQTCLQAIAGALTSTETNRPTTPAQPYDPDTL